MEKSIKSSEISKWLKYFFIILLFWLVVSWIFHVDRLPTDGERTYGIPYKVVIFYWSRKEDVIYDYSINYSNLFLNLFFIAIVTFFYYILFRKKGKQ